ncbi:MAG: imidazoleglycerol-phosphate dehydratase [Brockia lithotrophica]|nr:imidazoleglycerol-phosphate dehydratase [Brockia lithotrophica]
MMRMKDAEIRSEGFPRVRVTRTTRESRVVVGLAVRGATPDVKFALRTPHPFFSHMLEQVAWRSGLGIEVDVELAHFPLRHLVTEDVGTAFGRAAARLHDRLAERGVRGFAHAYAALDEALARAVLAFEGRAYLHLDVDERFPEETEGVSSEDLVAFFEGFVQGAGATLHLDLLRARPRHGHHLWEALFRAFGMALGDALSPSPERRGLSAGVAGRADYDVADE